MMPFPRPTQHQGGPAIAQDPAYASRTATLQPHLDQTLAGDFLSQENPFAQQVADRVARDANAAFDQQRANLARASMGVGRGGGSQWQQAMISQNDTFSQNVADALAQAQYGNYQNERGLQNAAAQAALAQDQGIMADVTARRGQDINQRVAKDAAVAQARAGALAGAANWKAEQLRAQVQEAQTRANLLLGQGNLAEQARQFDAQMGGSPLQWAQLLGGQLGQFGGQQNADTALLGNLMMGQQGNQLAAAGLGGQLGQATAGLGQQQLGQQLAATGLIPNLTNADLPALGIGADYMSDIYGSQAGLQAAQAQANASRFATQAQRDQMQYQSMMNQWNAANPNNALNQWLGQLGGISGLAGRTQSGFSAPNQYISPGQNPILAGLQGGLGAFLGMGGMGGGLFGGG